MAAVKLKKPKVAVAPAVKLPSLQKSKNGGITAPKSAAKGRTTGLSGNNVISPDHPNYVPKKTAGGNAGSTSSGAGAAPTTTSPSPATPAPPLQSTTEGRARSEATFKEAQKNDAWKRYQAALAYGDTNLINYWGQKAANLGAEGISLLNPGEEGHGQLQEISKQESSNQASNRTSHNEGNTFFSGFMLNDIQKIADTANNERSTALHNLETAINELNEAEKQAEATYGDEMRQFEQEDIKAAEEAELESSGPEEGGGGGDEGAPDSGGGGEKKKQKKPKVAISNNQKAGSGGNHVSNAKKAK